jgi:hypothetical protein
MIRLLITVLVAVGLTACTTVPVKTKVEMRSRLVSESHKPANYLRLARYWDEHAKKYYLNFTSASYLMFWEHERTADIAIGNGPYYGMIELYGLDEHTTRIRCYAWGALEYKITEWRKLIESAPND